MAVFKLENLVKEMRHDQLSVVKDSHHNNFDFFLFAFSYKKLLQLMLKSPLVSIRIFFGLETAFRWTKDRLARGSQLQDISAKIPAEVFERGFVIRKSVFKGLPH